MGARIFILAAFISFHFGAVSARAEIVDITVGSLGPACAICNGMLEGKLRHVPGIQKVVANLKDSTFTLMATGDQPLDLARVKQAVKDSGYGFRFIKLTLKGKVVDLSGRPAFQEPKSGQTFQLVQGERAPLSPEKLQEIKTTSADGAKEVEIVGMAYPGEPMSSLEPMQVSAVQ